MPHPALADGGGGADLAGLDQRVDGGKTLAGELEVGEQRRGARDVDDDDGRTGLLELGGDDLAGLARDDGERDEGRRDVEVLEGTRHRVLAADGGGAELELGLEGAEEGDERLAPALGVGAELLEVFLEGQAGPGGVATGGREAGQRFDDRADGAMAGRPLGDHRVEPVGHDGAGIGFPAQNGQFGRHGLLGGGLGGPAEGVEDRVSPDGGVKTLH